MERGVGGDLVGWVGEIGGACEVRVRAGGQYGGAGGQYGGAMCGSGRQRVRNCLQLL